MSTTRLAKLCTPALAAAAMLSGISASPASAHYYIPDASVPVGTCSIDEYGGYVDLGGFGLIPTVIVQPPTVDDGVDTSHCLT